MFRITKFTSLFAMLALALALSVTGTALAGVTGAISTTDNPGWQDTYDSYVNQACLNGQGVNCNQYLDKRDVWLSGLPVSAALGEGTYFFAVLSPGGQANPNDCAPLKANGQDANLSDTAPCPTSNTGAGDFYPNRTFSVDKNGNITNLGTHDFDSANNKIQLFPYDDTPNTGGVYILAVCSLAEYPVDPSECKYDAFKVGRGGENLPNADSLTVTKDASGNYDDTYGWAITKDVDKTVVKQFGGTATFNYSIKVYYDGGTISNVKVAGKITVFNPNKDDDNNPVPVNISSVTDEMLGGTCTVKNGGPQTLTQDKTDFAYECSLSSLPQGPLNNTATVSWPEQVLGNMTFLAAGSDDFIFENISFTEKKIDECVSVTDSYAGALGTVCVGDANPTTFTYSRTIPVPQWDCVSYDNTATFTTNDTGATGSASQTVTVCGPAKTGALTMGFWQNKNGQEIIKNYCGGTSGTSLYTFLTFYNPFKDLAASICSSEATYIYNVIKAASAAGASMNAMLKAQMLATALDVYFSDPALGGNKIGAREPIGDVDIDVTLICTDMTCVAFEDASSVFPSNVGGKESIFDLLDDASNACTSGSNGSCSYSSGPGTWYGNVKATQELAKDTFDAINNQKVFDP